MAPILDKVLKEFDNLELVKVDADVPENEDLLRDYDVRSIPTLVLVNNDGEIISALVGAHSKDQLKDWLKTEIGVDDTLEEVREDLDKL